MAATFTVKLGSLDLSQYCRMNPDDKFDPYSASFVEPTYTETPFSDGQALVSTTVQNREMHLPLFLSDSTHGKDALHALIRSINTAGAQRPLTLEWRDDGASKSTFFNVNFFRFEPDFNFRRSQRGYAAGILHIWTDGYGHTGTTRVAATAAATGVFLSVPIASVAGDALALMDTTITTGSIVPSYGRIVAVAPIVQPSYTPRIPAASFTDKQPGATLLADPQADGSQVLLLPVSPTGGASGIACKIPLPNPTIAGGDNRVLAVVAAGIDTGIAINAVDPYGNPMGATAVASNMDLYALVDLGVCRLPTIGYPTQPKISIYAGGIWSDGGPNPGVFSSPAFWLNEVLILPDKNLTLLFEQAVPGGMASVVSRSRFAGLAQLQGTADRAGNTWRPALNNANAIATPGNIATGNAIWRERGLITPGVAQTGTRALFDADMLPALQSDSMIVSAKPVFVSPAQGWQEVRLVKDIQASAFVQARFAASRFLSLESATGGGGQLGQLLASVQIATISANQKYVLSLQVQGPNAFVNLRRDDAGPIFATASMAYASVGVASNAGVQGLGAPAVAMTVGSAAIPTAAIDPQVYSWEVDTIPQGGQPLPFDSYRIDGVHSDTYRVSSAGVFAGQKLGAVQRGAFVKMAPSTTSVAVVAAPYDQGVASDLISAVVSVRERFNYGA